MKRPLPRTPAKWHEEIKLAIADVCEAIPFGEAIGEPITDANLFHLAPHVCLKFRGLKRTAKSTLKCMTACLVEGFVGGSKI